MISGFHKFATQKQEMSRVDDYVPIVVELWYLVWTTALKVSTIDFIA